MENNRVRELQMPVENWQLYKEKEYKLCETYSYYCYYDDDGIIAATDHTTLPANAYV